MEQNEAMEKIYLERYSKDKEKKRFFYAEQSLRWMIKKGIMPKDRNIRVLDLGCGTGLVYFSLKKLGFKRVSAADREKFFPEVIKSDIEKGLKIKKNSFDVIIARDVIEHMVNPDIFLKEAYRVLDKGGRIIILTPATEKMHIGDFYDGWDHHTPFTRVKLAEGLRLFGFKNVQVIYFRAIPVLWQYSLRAFDFLFNKKRCYLLGWASK